MTGADIGAFMSGTGRMGVRIVNVTAGNLVGGELNPSIMKTPMTPQAAARIQSATARSQGQVTKGGFVARAQRAAARPVAPAQSGKK